MIIKQKNNAQPFLAWSIVASVQDWILFNIKLSLSYKILFHPKCEDWIDLNDGYGMSNRENPQMYQHLHVKKYTE